ncbi:MAG: iron-containing alcohol dehydrogenase, partial [Rhodococcus sp. (in: high G+C Gram-positive bacteria)]
MVAHISFPRFLKLGPGAVEELGSVLVDLNVERPLLVTDAFMVGNGSADRLIRIIEAAGKKVALF